MDPLPIVIKTLRALSLSYLFLSGHTYTPNPQMISTHVHDHHYFSYKVLRSLKEENVHIHSVTRQTAPVAGGHLIPTQGDPCHGREVGTCKHIQSSHVLLERVAV